MAMGCGNQFVCCHEKMWFCMHQIKKKIVLHDKDKLLPAKDKSVWAYMSFSHLFLNPIAIKLYNTGDNDQMLLLYPKDVSIKGSTKRDNKECQVRLRYK